LQDENRGIIDNIKLAGSEIVTSVKDAVHEGVDMVKEGISDTRDTISSGIDYVNEKFGISHGIELAKDKLSDAKVDAKDFVEST